ncbi:MAG: carbohydrate kinase family protein [Ilumatobacteraceae bacterium]
MLATLGDLVEDIVVRLDGPINDASDTPARISRRRGGSAANVAARSAAAGHPTRFLGQVGDDPAGRALTDELAASGVDVSFVRRSGSTGTIVALVDPSGERSMLTDRRACDDLADPDPHWLDGVHVLHVPFYSLATGSTATTATTVIEWAHGRGIDVAIDLSSSAVLAQHGVRAVRELLDALAPSVVFANADEARVVGVDGPVGRALTVVKHGAADAVVHRPDGTSMRVPVPPIAPPQDTTGAGDAFAAGFLVSGRWGDDPVAACRSGHIAAAELFRSRP